ncbi:hypothetical protein K461DRAFT_229744 [Myriangium duriaei CBS 260.36]|uniref:ML-like domain-containing protein n=1 Tax=Myriangium duriaei CBS 260.36 TaxID=1168546 RepID=A0A9P4IU73_9PEZI|nr:hypothetical protein K461DRAFT_229744 [Myriangium duriaei CBS 260.36]
MLLPLFLALLVTSTHAAFIQFSNCLDAGILNSNPKQLQFVPYFFNARLNQSDPNKRLNITIYGNVTGQAVEGPYPLPNASSWTDPNSTFGKIVDISASNNRYSTLFQRFTFLSYGAASPAPSQFCLSTINESCPIGPSFNGTQSDPYSLSAFTVAQDLNSSYSFATIAATIRIRSGDSGAQDIACISANITPDLGSSVAGLIRYLPVAVLIFVGVATASAAIYSPWGSSDPFKWTTNYGRDQDLLRLVTPGFGDCLQYIQFVFLTGSLTLSYPGYYQPATSQLGWSSLAFNESLVSGGQGYDVLRDGIYNTNGTYGMTRMTQLIGLASQQDLWACMAVWLAVLCGTAIVFCSTAFFFRWLYFKLSNTSEEDRRNKAGPLIGGMLVRVIFNYFLLPFISISMFQLLLGPSSHFFLVIVAVIALFLVISIAFWILFIMVRTKPRAQLFDDLPTLLLYGSLYNTYNDERALFAIIPVVLTFMRGLAIGVIQATGIAQIIILAICEVVFILTVHGFRPFSSPTHMNVMHTIFATVRLATVLLMVAFMPSLGVNEGSKGWVGYMILLLHALVMVFGFFLNSIQTLIEVCARLAGAGGNDQNGAKRGALISYGWRQLRNRQPSRGVPRPGSMASDAHILSNDAESKHLNSGHRSRSYSANSRVLLGGNRTSMPSSIGEMATSPGVDSFMASSPTGQGPSTLGSLAGRRLSQTQADPYYRPPRARRPTLEAQNDSSGGKKRSSGEWGRRVPYDEWPDEEGEVGGGRDGLSPAFFRNQRSGSEVDIGEAVPRTDYAVREVDFYYGVTRGPALSSLPTRKRKTGPADPVGPVSNATTWFQRLVGGKKKDKGKGFEVVRSSRAPPPEVLSSDGPEEEGEEMQTSPPIHYPPYRDNPEGPQVAGAAEADIPEAGIPEAPKTKRRMPLDGPWDESESEEEEDGLHFPLARRPSSPPVLQPITRSSSINVGFLDRDGIMMTDQPPLPMVPRRSSRRNSSKDLSLPGSPPMLPGFQAVERPTSMGQVNHRLTGSSVAHGQAFGEGRSAEFVKDEQGYAAAGDDRRLDLD